MIDRSTGLGGTDARRIMEGDWFSLYEEKMGLRQPEDLSGVFRVALGSYTEPLHAEWFMRLSQLTVLPAPAPIRSVAEPFMFASLDRWLPTEDTFLEMKHTRSGVGARRHAQSYMAQLQHYLVVTERPRCFFSIIAGNEDPEWCVVEAHPEYQQQMLEAERAFWWHVENRVPPDITPVGTQERAKKMAFAVPIDGMTTLDMSHNNAWGHAAATWRDTRQAADRNDEAAKALKELIPDTCAEAFGHGILIRRNKRGSLVLRAKDDVPA